MKTIEALKTALLSDPTRARYLIDVSIDMGVTEQETAELVALAVELGAIGDGGSKMTNREKAEAYFMSLEGASLQEIGERFGVSIPDVAKMIPGYKPKRSIKNIEKCIYPAIQEFMVKNGLPYSRMANLCGCSRGAFYKALTGETAPTKITIDKILKTTEMTYEEAFRHETV